MENERVVEIMDLVGMVVGFNKKFGDHPTVFVSYSGHVDWVDVAVHEKGWFSGQDASRNWTIRTDKPMLFKEFKEIKNYLESII